MQDDPPSPCPSDRLSVTWADGERSVSSDAGSFLPRGQVSPDPAASITTQIPAIGSLLEEPLHEEEDLNASVTAILRRSSSKASRRGSRKKKKLRRTSTMTTTSSGETVVEVEGLSEEEEVEETLRIHKEVLAGVKQQPWSISRKLRLARSSREYIDRHEGQLEERLAQSSSTKDVILRHFIRVRRVVRGGLWAWYTWATGLEAWQGRIKTIESHFGSAVASYFTFLRWVLGLNLVLALLLGAFVIIPEFLAAERQGTGERKAFLNEEVRSGYDFKVMWDFEGVMRYSPIFYGYYSKTHKTREGYRLPLAYFLTSLAVYAYSFVAILRKMAANSRMSKLSEDEEYTFSWRLLAGWDFTIGNPEAAQNKVAAINTGFRESLLEARELEKEEKSWKLRARRILAHFLVVLLVAASAYAVVLLVKRSEGANATSSWWRQNELTIILTLISLVYPNLFDLVGLLEQRHPRNQLQWQLARIMALNLLNLYTLIFALFSKVDDMSDDLEVLKENVLAIKESLVSPSPFPSTTSTIYYNVSDSPFVSLHNTSASSYDDNGTMFGDPWALFPNASLTVPNVTLLEGLGSTLGSLVTVAAFTSQPISKTAPELQRPSSPGCYRLPAPCQVSSEPLPPGISPSSPLPHSVTTSPVEFNSQTSDSSVSNSQTSDSAILNSPTPDSSLFNSHTPESSFPDLLTPGIDVTLPATTLTMPPSTLDSNSTTNSLSANVFPVDNDTWIEPVYVDDEYGEIYGYKESAYEYLDDENATEKNGITNENSHTGSTGTYYKDSNGNSEEDELNPASNSDHTAMRVSDTSTKSPSYEGNVGNEANSVLTIKAQPDMTTASPTDDQYITMVSSTFVTNDDMNNLTNSNTNLDIVPLTNNEPVANNVEEMSSALHMEEYGLATQSPAVTKSQESRDLDNFVEAIPGLSVLKTFHLLADDVNTDGGSENTDGGNEYTNTDTNYDSVGTEPGSSANRLRKRNADAQPHLEQHRKKDTITKNKKQLLPEDRNDKERYQAYEEKMQRTIDKGNLRTQDEQTDQEERQVNDQENKGGHLRTHNDNIRGHFKTQDDQNHEGERQINGQLDKKGKHFRTQAKENRQDNGYQEEESTLRRVKRVYDDYDHHVSLGVDSPYNIAAEEDPRLVPASTIELTDELEDVNNGTELMANFTIDNKWEYKPLEPHEYPTLSTRDIQPYFDAMKRNLTLNQDVTESMDSNLTTTEESMDASLTTGTTEAFTISTSTGEAINITDDGYQNTTKDYGDAVEEYECVIIVCDRPLDEITPSSPTTPPLPSTPQTTTTLLTSEERQTTLDLQTTPDLQTALDFQTTLDLQTSTLAPSPTPKPFLVQPMKDNPEKWASCLGPSERGRLRKLCWETMFGQEIIKLTVMDLVVTVVTIVMGDYIKAVVVRLFNGWCCCDLEKKFPGYPDFKIAENILHLVNNQGMVWMGMFFAPGLPILNTLKLVILMYVRSWAVVTSNVPPETVFKASNNNNFYLLFLLTMLFLCTLPVGYAVVWLAPSWHCGPFSDYPKIYQLATSTLIGGLPTSFHPVIDYISSPGVVIPAGLLLVLVIYYLLSLTAALREANSDLRDQLRHERSAEKLKAQDARSGKNRPETPTTRWGRVVPLTPMPRPRLHATSDNDKPVKKSPTGALSPESEGAPVAANGDVGRCRDDGPWPDDVTDLGHSEVFDDSLSETRKPGRDLEGPVVRHERRRTAEQEFTLKSPRIKKKVRKNSYPPPSREEHEQGTSKESRPRHKTLGQTKVPRLPQERKQSDESINKDSPTRAKHGHRQFVDSPRERRRSSGSGSGRLKYKTPENYMPEVMETMTQKEAPRQNKSPRKFETQRANTEPETPTKGRVQHRREPSILKMDDLRRNSQGRGSRDQPQAKAGTKSGHNRSSSEDSQSLHTIPVIKISKEDSVERSLQQAKLQRQDKTQQDPDDDTTTASDTTPLLPSEVLPSSTVVSPSPPSDKVPPSTNISSSSNSDKAPNVSSSSPSDKLPNISDNVSHVSSSSPFDRVPLSPTSTKGHDSEPLEMKSVVGKDSPSHNRLPPTETNLDDPNILDHSSSPLDQTSDTTALLGEAEEEEDQIHLATEEPSSIKSSDEESTLHEK